MMESGAGITRGRKSTVPDADFRSVCGLTSFHRQQLGENWVVSQFEIWRHAWTEIKKAMTLACSVPIVRIAELEIDPAQLDGYRAALREEIEASIKMEPGVLVLHAASIADNPAHIRVFEVYADKRAYEAHLTTPHFLRYKALTSTMVRSLHLIEMDPLILRAKTIEGS
jgi:quinol monooxygenase YgiN